MTLRARCSFLVVLLPSTDEAMCAFAGDGLIRIER
jgi:hypothetical protein